MKGFRPTRQAPLRQPDGSTFPATLSASGERADAEALRIDPRTGGLLWSSEGDSARGFDPSLRRMDRDGLWTGDIRAPSAFRFDPARTSGARPNQTFEGVSFSPDGRWSWLVMEAPFIEDGRQSGSVLAKRLLVNFDRMPGGAANFEAMAWGLVIGGKRTLVLFADDNFAATEPQRIAVMIAR